MRLLVFDHHFSQDIDAITHVAGDYTFKVVPARVLGKVAWRYFPSVVFSSGLSEYWRPCYAAARDRYAIAATRMLHDLYCVFPFDAIVSPSDTFFYIRPWVTAAREMGVPFIVLQKETTISPLTMSRDAEDVGRWFPFIADLMLVCSEHHKRFWTHSGAEPDKIVVTGQPRFDFYRQPLRWRTLADLGVRLSNDRPVLLFFSYDLDAYAPDVGVPTWAQLRTETETVLLDLARSGDWQILIKPHPQQREVDVDSVRLRTAAGALWGRSVHLLPRALDTRQLIVNADSVVGFQTTALFEAMVAGKPVTYTFWTEPTRRFADQLIPFHAMSAALSVAGSPQQLNLAVLSTPAGGQSLQPARLEEAEQVLGHIDGGASRRALDAIVQFTTGHSAAALPAAVSLRRVLADRAPAYCRFALRRAQLAAAGWSAVEWAFPLFYLLWRVVHRMRPGTGTPAGAYADLLNEVSARRRSAVETIDQCKCILGRHSRTKLTV